MNIASVCVVLLALLIKFGFLFELRDDLLCLFCRCCPVFVGGSSVTNGVGTATSKRCETMISYCECLSRLNCLWFMMIQDSQRHQHTFICLNML